MPANEETPVPQRPKLPSLFTEDDWKATKLRYIGVGVNKFKDPKIRNLRCCVKDAQALYAGLIDRILREDIESGNIPIQSHIETDFFDGKVFLDEEATMQTVAKEIQLAVATAIQNQEALILQISTHGTADGRFILHDSDASDPKKLKSTSIDMKLVKDLINHAIDDARLKFALVLIDACFGGLVNDEVKPSGEIPALVEAGKSAGYMNRIYVPAGSRLDVHPLGHFEGEGRIILSGARADEPAIENHHPDVRHGVATYEILKAWGHDDPVSKSLLCILDQTAEGIPHHAGRMGVVQEAAYSIEEAQRRLKVVSLAQDGPAHEEFHL